MEIPASVIKKIAEKYGPTIDLRKNPKIIDDIFEEVKAVYQADLGEYKRITEPAPFGISWMDSWAAHWIVNQRDSDSTDLSPEKEFNSVLKGLVELKFKDRLSEIRRFIDLRFDEPPDGGPPEPGAPNPPGPSSIEPPDGGTPEPGVPPEGPAGIDPGLMRENPWILYWFVSIKAPLILDMIDAHFTRRINELTEQNRHK
jgi:hypothetical protein